MNIDYNKLNNSVRELIKLRMVNPNIGIAKQPVPVKIESSNYHSLKHGVTQEEAQRYVDTSVVMFDQGNRSMFLSPDGSAAILDESRRLIMAYPSADFDPGIISILEAVKSGG
jgi:hypothetical protein